LSVKNLYGNKDEKNLNISGLFSNDFSDINIEISTPPIKSTFEQLPVDGSY